MNALLSFLGFNFALFFPTKNIMKIQSKSKCPVYVTWIQNPPESSNPRLFLGLKYFFIRNIGSTLQFTSVFLLWRLPVKLSGLCFKRQLWASGGGMFKFILINPLIPLQFWPKIVHIYLSIVSKAVGEFRLRCLKRVAVVFNTLTRCAVTVFM